jgi:transposase
MKKSPKENPAKSGQKRSKPARSGHSGPDRETGPAAETNNLKPSQQQALIALLEERSIAAAARRTGIGERTIRRWLDENDDFQDELRRVRQQQLSHAATRLQSTAGEAVQTLRDLLASKDHIEPGRAVLVRTALDFAFRAGAYTDLTDRIQNLEEEARKQREKGFTPTPRYRHALEEDPAEAA